MPAADLIDAVIAQLENVQAIDLAFNDTWNQGLQTGTPKFFADLAAGVSPPWCVITEAGETYQYVTAVVGGVVSFMSPGQMIFSIFASGRLQARQLGFSIAKALNDYPLMWPAEKEMVFRMGNSRFNPISDIGPGVPVMFNRVFLFDYEYQGAL